ncbi:MAG TPA: hypothetical protein VFY16_10085, partial [Gemmatimonadaceae bacterium]|nr:hypothetical protein [Gemmatimonadaceae bacterium]
VLDGLFAVGLCMALNPECSAVRVFQGIARAVIGKGAFEGGLATASLGLAMHVGVAVTWAAAYLVLYRRWAWLRERVRTPGGVIAASAAWGALVWLTMRFVVIPLTLAPGGPVASWSFVTMIVGHMVVVGLPIVAIVREAQ